MAAAIFDLKMKGISRHSSQMSLPTLADVPARGWDTASYATSHVSTFETKIDPTQRIRRSRSHASRSGYLHKSHLVAQAARPIVALAVKPSYILTMMKKWQTVGHCQQNHQEVSPRVEISRQWLTLLSD
jgi:hypothetical protein